MYDDSDDATQFDPNPFGGRQRLLPKRTFKAVASVITQLPPASMAERLEIEPLPPVFSGRLVEAPRCEMMAAVPALPSPVPPLQMLAAATPTFGAPIVREADIPTWRVPKMPLHPARNGKLAIAAIGGLLALVIISILATRSGDDIRVEAASISAALGGEAVDANVHGVSDVEQPPELIVTAPIGHRVVKRVKRGPSKHQLLAVDVSTPLGDLAKQRRR